MTNTTGGTLYQNQLTGLAVTPSQLATGGFGTAAGQAIPIPAYGGDTSFVSGGSWRGFQAQVDLNWPRQLTGLGYWVGGSTNGHAAAALYNAAGTLVASSNPGSQSPQPGVLFSHQVPFGSPYNARAGTYVVQISFDDSRAGMRGGPVTLVPIGVNAASQYPPQTSIAPPAFEAAAIVNMPHLYLY